MKKFGKYEVFIVLLLGVLRLTAKKLSEFSPNDLTWNSECLCDSPSAGMVRPDKYRSP